MKTRFVILHLLLIFGLSRCTEDIIPIKGNIVGFVRLLDDEGDEIQDRSGVKVTLTDRITAMTDESGKFEFRNVEAGTYIVLFEKEGFGTFKSYNFTFAGGNRPAVLTNIYLLKLTEIELTQLNIFAKDNLNVEVKGSITESTRYNISYFFGTSDEVSNFDYKFTYSLTYCCGPVTTFDHNIVLDGSKFQSGQKVYMVMYASNQVNQFGLYSYYDYEMGVTIDPALKSLTPPIEVTLK